MGANIVPNLPHGLLFQHLSLTHSGHKKTCILSLNPPLDIPFILGKWAVRPSNHLQDNFEKTMPNLTPILNIGRVGRDIARYLLFCLLNDTIWGDRSSYRLQRKRLIFENRLINRPKYRLIWNNLFIARMHANVHYFFTIFACILHHFY